MRNLRLCFFISIFSVNAVAGLSVEDIRHACSQLVEQEKSWTVNLTTSREEAFLAGRCEGAIRIIVEDSRGCRVPKGKLVDAAIKVSKASYSYSVPEHIRAVLGCRS